MIQDTSYINQAVILVLIHIVKLAHLIIIVQFVQHHLWWIQMVNVFVLKVMYWALALIHAFAQLQQLYLIIIVLIVASNTVIYVKLTMFVQIVQHLLWLQVMELAVYVFLDLFNNLALVFVRLAKSNQVTNAFHVFKIVIHVQQLLLAINVIHHISWVLIILLVIVNRTKQSKELHVSVFLVIFNITKLVFYVILVVVHHVRLLMFVPVVLRILF